MLWEESIHLSLSLLVGATVGSLTGNYWAMLAALLAGFFVDTDHLIDYIAFKKFKGLNLKEFLSGKFFDDSGKVYVLFHGYEFALIYLFAGIFWSQFNWLFLALGLSHFLHLLYDQISNKPIWPTYFISYRIAHNFNHNDFQFKKCEVK